MLIPITQEKLRQLVPVVATGAQYRYVWGKLQDVLRRVIFAVVAVAIVAFGLEVLGDGLQLVLGLIAGLYWLWAPAVLASLRNRRYRRFPYAGFWQGRVLEVYVTEELVGKEETVNDQGQLVIIENRERCLNLEVGDKSGFETTVRTKLLRQHRVIRAGDVAQMLVLSRRPDLAEIELISEVYLPRHRLWIGTYPILQRDVFIELSETLRQQRRSPRKSPRPRRSTL
ncbi:hypothetical protein RYO59_000711 [Thermosynechococcaceae cyanobacterium Okahandja]